MVHWDRAFGLYARVRDINHPEQTKAWKWPPLGQLKAVGSRCRDRPKFFSIRKKPILTNRGDFPIIKKPMGNEGKNVQ
jgi:hypothetical protein